MKNNAQLLLQKQTVAKGDVVLLHPLMLHSASKNHLRVPRVITNPPVALKAPFQFARNDPDEYSLVELKTLKALGLAGTSTLVATADHDVAVYKSGRNISGVTVQPVRQLNALSVLSPPSSTKEIGVSACTALIERVIAAVMRQP